MKLDGIVMDEPQKKCKDAAQVEFGKIEQTQRFASFDHRRSVYTQKAEEVATNG